MMVPNRMTLTFGPAEAGLFVKFGPVGMTPYVRLEGAEAEKFIQQVQAVEVSQLEAWLFSAWEWRLTRPVEATTENLTLGERMTALEAKLDKLIVETRKTQPLSSEKLWEQFQRVRKRDGRQTEGVKMTCSNRYGAV